MSLVHGQSFDPNKASPQSWDPAQVGTNTTTNTTYNNPIFTQNVGDPWMTKYSLGGDDWYLFTYTTNDNITLRRSRSLTDNWDDAEARVVFSPDSSGEDAGQPWSTDIWAPEVHTSLGPGTSSSLRPRTPTTPHHSRTPRVPSTAPPSTTGCLSWRVRAQTPGRQTSHLRVCSTPTISSPSTGPTLPTRASCTTSTRAGRSRPQPGPRTSASPT